MIRLMVIELGGEEWLARHSITHWLPRDKRTDHDILNRENESVTRLNLMEHKRDESAG